MLNAARALALLARREGVRVAESELAEGHRRGEFGTLEGVRRFFGGYGLAIEAERPGEGFPSSGRRTPAVAIMRDGTAHIVLGPPEPGKSGPGVPVVKPEEPGRIATPSPDEFAANWTGKTLRFSGSSESRRLDKADWRTCAFSALRRPGVSLALVALSLVSAASALAPILYLQIALDRVVGYEVGATLVLLTVAALVTLAVGYAATVARQRLLEGLALDFQRRMARELAGRATNAAERGDHVETEGAYAFPALDAVTRFAFHRVGKSALDLLGVFLFMPLIFAYNTVLGVVVSTFLALAAVLTAALGARAGRMRSRAEASGRARDSLVKRTLGSRDMIARAGFGAGRRIEIDRSADARAEDGEASQGAQAASSDALRFLQAVMTIAVVGIGVELVFADAVTAGSLIAVNLLASRSLQPVTSFAGLLPERKDAAKSLRVLDAVLAWPERRKDVGKRPTVLGGITARNVATPDVPGLTWSFDVRPGALHVLFSDDEREHAVAGLLDGARDPAEGELRIDGVPTAEFNPDHLKRNVARIPATPAFVAGTVRDNLHGMHPDVDPEEMDRVTSAMGLDTRRLPEGAETEIDTSGRDLSQEAATRLAVARAAAVTPVAVVLDRTLDGLPDARAVAVLTDLRKTLPKATAIVATGRERLLTEADAVTRPAERGPNP